jgi:hypothetical protein
MVMTMMVGRSIARAMGVSMIPARRQAGAGQQGGSEKREFFHLFSSICRLGGFMANGRYVPTGAGNSVACGQADDRD